MYLAQRTYSALSHAVRTLATITALALATLAGAQSPAAVDFDLPPQPLELSLRQIADAQKLQLVYTRPDVNGVKAPAIKGRYTAAEAVSKATEGSGLVATFTRSDTVVIKPKPDDKGGQAANPTLLAQAQSAERREDRPGSSQQQPVRGEGIIVTATKREERLIDVPMSVGVVTKDEIDQRRLVNAEDYLRGMPGVTQHEAQGFGGQAIIIRGMATDTSAQNFFSGVTTANYFGETPTSSSAGLAGSNVDIKLVDVERVEVLRGPQGSAFGSSSMGGAVRIIPVEPKLGQPEGKVSASYSLTSGTGGDNYNIQAVANVPIIRDQVAIRVAAYSFWDSGFYRNRAGSDPAFQVRAASLGAQAFAKDQDQVGLTHAFGARVTALYEATSNLRFKLTFLSQRNQTDGFPQTTTGSFDQISFAVAPEHIRRGRPEGATDLEINLANATVEYDLGWADILATYSRVSSGTVTAFVGNNTTARSLAYQSPHNERNGEIRIATKFNGAWNALAGLYGEEFDDALLMHSIWFGSPASNTLNPGNRLLGGQEIRRKVNQVAAFGEVSWKILPRLTLTGGGRSFRYDRIVDAFGFGNQTYDPIHEDAISKGDNYRANIAFRPTDNSLIYAGFSQGFRLGVPQRGLPTRICDTDGDGIADGSSVSLASTRLLTSDTVDNYEIGGKAAMFGNRIVLDAAIYRMDWAGLPIQGVRVGSTACQGFGYLVNAGTARSEGMELQTVFRITKALELDVGGSYVNARLTKDLPLQGFRVGDRLPGSPKTTAKVGVKYRLDVSGLPVAVRADAIYIPSFYMSVLPNPLALVGGYTKINASVRVSIKDLDIDFYGSNLTNEDAYTIRFGESGYRLRPRTIGIQLGYRF